MSISIAQSRQQLSALIAAAQQEPQIITNRNTPVAVLVSADYFEHTKAAAQPGLGSFYTRLQALRESYLPQDETGLPTSAGKASRAAAWQRANAFADLP